MAIVLIVLFGVILPMITLIVELSTGMCAEAFFDPLPTGWHILLVGFVPLANLAGVLGAANHWSRRRGRLLWANGIALGIALVYTMVFVPMIPIAIIGLVVWGMGFLPLTPLCSLLAAIGVRRALLNVAPPAAAEGQPPANPSGVRSLLGGMALGVLLLAAAEARTVVTRLTANWALAESPQGRAAGLRLLRTLGSRDALLRMCYRSDDRTWFGGASGGRSLGERLLRDVDRADAQQLYFRVTGKAYNSQPMPNGIARQFRDDWDFDPDVGGQAVAGVRRGLRLDSSRIDARLHADAAAGSVQWTMVFHNDRFEQREARAQVLLPPGGVVSQVTLWVNGEPREAAFAGAGKVRTAYQKVAVAQRRDPLLVTWAAPDRVLVQCFPIPPHGEMKIRLGITVPLWLPERDTAALRLPCLAEHNFSVAGQSLHKVWVDSDRPLCRLPAELHEDPSEQGQHALHGEMSDAALASGSAVIVAARSAGADACWTENPKERDKQIVQTLVARDLPDRRPIVLVVDGSSGMTEHYAAIAQAVGQAKADKPMRVLLAGDEVVDLSEALEGDAAARSAAMLARLRAAGGRGGCDDIPALLQACETPGGRTKTIVWLHAAQPVLLQSPEGLAQRLEHDRGVTVYDLPVSAGPNRLVEQLKDASNLRAAPRLGTLTDDLTALLGQLSGGKEYRFDRNCRKTLWHPADREVDVIVVQRNVGSALSVTIDEKLADRLAKLDGIEAVVPRLVDAVVLDELKHSDIVIVDGIPSRSFTLTKLDVVQGVRLTDAHKGKNVVMVSQTLAEKLGKKVDDRINIYDVDFRIVGIFDTSDVIENGSIVMLLDDLQKFSGKPHKVTGFMVRLKNPTKEEIERVRKAIRELDRHIGAIPAYHAGERLNRQKAMAKGPPAVGLLWAADQVAAKLQSGSATDRAAAVKLASQWQLVTPVSGAVVLETRQQYKDSGLTPPPEESTADVPEPATWVLLLAALPGLWWLSRRRRSGQ